LEEILGFKIFPECFRGPRKTTWRATFGPRAANCPPLPYAYIKRSIKKCRQCYACFSICIDIYTQGTHQEKANVFTEQNTL